MEQQFKRVTLRMSAEVHEWYRLRSKKTGVPAASMMALALEQYVQQQNMLPLIPEILEKAREYSAK